MRFDVFYFDNRMDPGHPLDPRRILTESSWPVLEAVALHPAGADDLLRDCQQQVNALTEIGVLRRTEDGLRFDTPVFLREDAAVLNGLYGRAAGELAARLNVHRPALHALAGQISNGFSPAQNLYHILCGMVLDGAFFDALCAAGTVATSRLHPSGMDYLTIIYQQCPELDGLSRRLLCSWNRLLGQGIALQSFGDADGVRHDLYRAYTLEAHAAPECGTLPPREALLGQARALAESGACEAWALNVLERYGYAADGEICVPVFRREDEATVQAIARFVEKVLLAPVNDLLLQCKPDITAVRHGVNRRELANELYHILFGQLNEELVRTGLVAPPEARPGEGRYMRSIQLF